MDKELRTHCLPSLTKRNALIKKWTFPERPAESFCQTYSLSGKTSQQAFSCQSLRWFFFFKFLNGTDSNLEKLGRPLIDVHTLFKVVKCLLCDWNKKKNIELPNSPLPESKQCSKTVRKELWARNDKVYEQKCIMELVITLRGMKTIATDTN